MAAEYERKLASLRAQLFALVLICAPTLGVIYGLATREDTNVIERAWESETYAEQLILDIDPDIPGRNRAALARAAVDAHEKHRCIMGAEVDQAIAELGKISAINYVADLLEDDELAKETYRRLRKVIDEPELKEAPVSSITIPQGETGSD